MFEGVLSDGDTNDLDLELIEPLPGCVVLDDHNLIGFITRLGDILSLVEMWFEEMNYG